MSEAFPENRERAIGLFTSIFPIGALVGPNLGGWIVTVWSWRYIFYINIPIGLALIALIWVLLEDSKAASRPRRIDMPGVLLASGAVLFVMTGLHLAGERSPGGSLLPPAAFLAAGLALVPLFRRPERKETSPILDISLLKSTPFVAANLLNMLMGACVFGVFSFVPLYATSVQKLSTMMSGVILTPRSFGIIPASAVTAFMLKRWGYRRPIMAGLALVSVTVILLGEDRVWGLAGVRMGAPETISLLVLIGGIGMGMLFPAVNNACIELMPDRVATIVGLRGMFRVVGGALGISLVTLILHGSATPATGFRAAFTAFGIELLCAIPLVFLMPDGRADKRAQTADVSAGHG